MKCCRYCVIVAFFALTRSLGAAELTVHITDARGAAVADAVVTIVPRDSTAATTRKASAETKVVDQKAETFNPYVEIFRPGDSVVFHNSDQTRHHVYSFAPTRRFEFVLTSGQSSAPLQLDQVGVVAVGCNIHDRMITYLYVADAPWIARSAINGQAIIDALPAGDFDVRVWHPQLRPGRPDSAQPLHIAESGDAKQLAVSLSLLPDPRAVADRERTSY